MEQLRLTQSQPIPRTETSVTRQKSGTLPQSGPRFRERSQGCQYPALVLTNTTISISQTLLKTESPLQYVHHVLFQSQSFSSLFFLSSLSIAATSLPTLFLFSLLLGAAGSSYHSFSSSSFLYLLSLLLGAAGSSYPSFSSYPSSSSSSFSSSSSYSSPPFLVLYVWHWQVTEFVSWQTSG